MSKRNLTEEQIKKLFCQYVMPLKELGESPEESIIRHIIFTMATDIDWQEVLRIMLNKMPEISWSIKVLDK